MEYTLPPLPYAFDALEPYIDAKTMEIHHDKHHQGYVDKLNEALKKDPKTAQIPLVELLADLNKIPENIRTDIRNQGGGHLNHSFFWPIMKKNGGGLPKGKIAEEIKKTFSSFDAFQKEFNEAAKKVFGSGWAWLVIDKEGKLKVVSTHNQDTPVSQKQIPIMGLDVWEHAYYLKYQNKRPDYINAWWHVLNWDMIEDHYKQAAK
jgi:Fe-Mn family superoxide dismutase